MAVGDAEAAALSADVLVAVALGSSVGVDSVSSSAFV